ncbi:putative bifunctional diguanylate cyclase/phosphodiesterase [Coralloluteibacterium thermophilus]|uniref:Bifunctional diguanylate cyclase/phosphodiesterase n=1 Tax=Coralloluteibacterium thermophilum TaxID=2707049 RepID=A0ABV9NKB8_9GAMM
MSAKREDAPEGATRVRRPRLGLSMRFGLLLVGALLLLVVAAGLLWYQQTRSVAEVVREGTASLRELAFESLEERGQGQAAQIADSLANPLYYFDLAVVGDQIGALKAQADVAYVYVYDREGRVIHDGSRGISTYGQPMDDPLAFRSVVSDGPVVQWSPEIMDVAHPITLGSERLGGVRIGYGLARIAESQANAQRALAERLHALGRQQLVLETGLVGLAVIVTLLLSLFVERAFVRPVRRLADTAREIEAGRFEAAAAMAGQHDARRHDEIGDLVRAFGRMSESVARHDRDIRTLAFSDALTGLPNRYAFRELLDESLQARQNAGDELALLFIDLDDFKRINDTLGHDAGDDVLEHFAARIDACLRRAGLENARLARFGGDEFIAFATGREMRTHAAQLAEAIIEVLQRPFEVRGARVHLSASIGIALYPHDATSTVVLLKSGDVAMYQAKVAGKSCYRFYSRAMDQAVERRMRMEQDLHGAWERGELSVEYQPIYQLADGRMVGAEALLRWAHPRQGRIPPSVFIDVAEQSGLIEQLGRHVLERACADAVRWGEAMPDQPPFVAVNVSARQLRGGGLPEVVANALAAAGLDAARLHVELTETAVLGDELQAGSLLARLRSSGVKVWLDDFGTGFSGLSHLRRVPVDGVKIDRSFVADVLRDPDDLALTSAIIAMAHSLGITVVAEGVENEGQHDVLRERGCDLAQGYWLGRPMSADALMLQMRTPAQGIASIGEGLAGLRSEWEE